MTKTAPNPALFYSAADYSTSGERLMGKHAANEGFLKAYVEHSGQDEYYCYSMHQGGFKHFTDRVGYFSEQREATTRWISSSNLHSMDETGCLYIPSSQIDELMWHRRWVGQRKYSICGITHTMASEGPMNVLRNVLFFPTQKWDALICTSTAVKMAVEHSMNTWKEYFCQRFGASDFVIPLQLPVIPLGVDTAFYKETWATQQARAVWRNKFDIGDDDVVFLFVGRLSAHAKAHPVAMYRALEMAAQKTDKKVHLIQSGWFSNEGIETAFKEGARDVCPSVNAIFIDGRETSVRKDIWATSDVFISLSDNIQETFGLTPIEAMAAGLPVVVSDWDGYKDTVRDGVDGIMVPTMSPPPGMSGDLAYRFDRGIDNYDLYLANTCQVTSVDIAACAAACLRLIDNPELRREMGEAGRIRAQEKYDWKHVIASYQGLWGELAELRKSSEESVPAVASIPPNPTREDPFAVFENYPTQHLQGDDIVCLLPDYAPEDFLVLRKMKMLRFGHLASDELFLEVLNRLKTEGAMTMDELVSKAPQQQRQLLKRSLIWCAKVGMISIGSHNAS